MAKPLQIGISLDQNIHNEVARLADREGVSRPEFMRRLALEAIKADLDGRPLFAHLTPPKRPTIDSSVLVAMTAQLEKTATRLDAVLRAHDRRDAALMTQVTLSADAIHEAQQVLAQQLQQWLAAGIDPYREELRGLRAIVAQQANANKAVLVEQHDALADTLPRHPIFTAILEQLVKLEKSVSKGRPNITVALGDKLKFSWWEVTAWALSALIAAYLTLAVIAHVLPDDWFATPIARSLFSNSQHGACALSGGHYRSDGGCYFAGGRFWK